MRVNGASSSSRRLVLWVPAVTVALVGWLLLGWGRPQPVLGARLSGGPSEARELLSWRLEVVRSQAGLRSAAVNTDWRGQVRLASGTVLWVSGTTDERGTSPIDVALSEPSQGPITVRLTHGAEPLLHHRFELSRSDWQATLTRRGGWLAGKQEGELRIRAAALRGAFAVPFEGELRVQVHAGAATSHSSAAPNTKSVAPAKVEVELQLDGGRVVGPTRQVVNERGECWFKLVPEQHSMDLTLAAKVDNATGRFNARLPVVPGALSATREAASALRIVSPVPRSRAYFSLIDEQQRLGGGSVELSPDARGGAEGDALLPSAIVERLDRGQQVWAVVSSEVDLNSAGHVGWPLLPERLGEPSTTLEVHDLLLANGVEVAEAREGARQRRVSRWAAALALCGGLLTASLLISRLRTSAQRWERDLTDALGTESSAVGAGQSFSTGSRAWSVLAIVCVLVGALAIAAFALWRSY